MKRALIFSLLFTIWTANANALVDVDVSSMVQVNRGAPTNNYVTKQTSVSISVKNISAGDQQLPIRVTLDSISPSSITSANADGMGANGKPYFQLSFGSSSVLRPGETSSTKVINFNNPNKLRFNFTTKAYISVNAEGAGIVGPDGGTIEVNNPQSPIYGTKVFIPQGILATQVGISISIDSNPPNKPLPEGMSKDGVAISFNSSENIQDIIFVGIPYNSYMLNNEVRAVYTYNNTSEKWEVVTPNPTPDPSMFVGAVRHFSTFQRGKKFKSGSWTGIMTGFEMGVDTLLYQNGKYLESNGSDYKNYCTKNSIISQSVEGICLGIGSIAGQYFNSSKYTNEINLMCRWGEVTSVKEACDAQNDFSLWDSILNAIENWQTILNGFGLYDYSYVLRRIQQNAEDNKVTQITLDKQGGVHRVVALGWKETAVGIGEIPIYNVNNNKKEEKITYSTENGSVKMQWIDPSTQEIVYNISIIDITNSEGVEAIIDKYPNENLCNTSTAPNVSLSVTPGSINQGQCSVLSWSSTNATTVSIDQGIGNVAASGTQSICPTSTTIYTITASGPGGTDTKSVTLNVVGAPLPPPIVNSWMKTFGGPLSDHGYSVEKTKDGGYIITGNKGWSSAEGPRTYVYLIKTDGAGNTLWEKTFLRTGYQNAVGSSVQQTSDGGYVVVGSALQWNGYAIYVIKTDEEGEVVWEAEYGGYAGKSIRQTSDGGYIILASDYNPYVRLFKIDENGALIWHKISSPNVVGSSVELTSDGGYIVAGETLIGDRQIYLLKADANGDVIWEKTFGEAFMDYGRSAQQTSDGGYIITGKEFSTIRNGYYLFLVKVDADGNLLWEKTYGDADAQEVRQVADGGYIVAGSTVASGSGGRDCYLMKTDVTGTFLWEKTYGGSGNDECVSVRKANDGGYIFVGYTESFGAGYTDVYVVKTDGNGNVVP